MRTLIFILLLLAALPVVSGSFEERFENGDYYMGENNSIITLYEYANWYGSCCNGFWTDGAFLELKEKYVDTGIAKFIFRDWIFIQVDWPYEERFGKMAEAVECAGDQGIYYGYGDYLYYHTPDISNMDVLKTYLKQYASNLNLNRTLFDNCLDTEKYYDEWYNDSLDAKNNVDYCTPSFVIKYKDTKKVINCYCDDGFSYINSQIKDLLNEQNITIASDDLYINTNTTLYSHKYKLKDSGNLGVIIINSSNIVFDCNLSSITGNNSGYGIYANGFENITIKNCVIENHTYGIYLNNSENVFLINNTLENNWIGFYSENSNSTVHSNFVCNNINSDFNSSDWLTTSGDNNTCDNPDGWDDTGNLGCSFGCSVCLGEGGIWNKSIENISCCSGLTNISCSFNLTNDTCAKSNPSCFVCTKCSNGICGIGENPCNCPMDCLKYYDLAVIAVTYTPQNPVVNDTVTITGTVRNAGTQNAHNVTIKFLLDGNLTDYKILNISSNSNVSVEFNWTGVLGGYNITIIVDSENLINESNESNNNATISFLVRDCIIPHYDFYVNEDTLLCEGVYDDTYIIVNASGVVLDCNGAVLNGSRGTQKAVYKIGIRNTNFSVNKLGGYKEINNVTIKNCNIRNYDVGIGLGLSNNITLKNNDISFNYDGILMRYSSNNTISYNNINNNSRSGIYIHFDSKFNLIKNNEIRNSYKGVYLSNCHYAGELVPPGAITASACHTKLNFNNSVIQNEISNNNIGIYSQNSTSTINSNTVCNNNLDFNSSDWLNSSGTNNTCDSGNWNDAGREGCTHICYRPDFTVANLTFLPAKATEGTTIKITASINNSGNINLNLSTVNVSLFIDSISKNSTILNLTNIINKTANFNWIAEEGTHEIKIKIDPENEIDESDETNNELSDNLSVTQKLDGGTPGGGGKDDACTFDGDDSDTSSKQNGPAKPINKTYENLTQNKTYSESAACFENYEISKDAVIFLYSNRCPHCAEAIPHAKELEKLNYSFYWAEMRDEKTHDILGCVDIVEGGILPIFICPATGKVIYAEIKYDKIKKFYDECKNVSKTVITFRPSINIFISSSVEDYTAAFNIDVKNDIGHRVDGKLLIKIINITTNETHYISIENLTLNAYEKKNINFTWTGENGEYKIIIEYCLYSDVFIKEKTFKIYVEEIEIQPEAENYTGICIVYLYEPNCLSCNRVKPLISELKEKYNLTIKSYNTYEKYEESIEYFKDYNVSKDKWVVPAVFIGNTFLINEEIDGNLENEILKYVNKGIRCGFMDESNESIINVAVNITGNITENLTEKSAYNLTVAEGKICLLLFMSPLCAECHTAESYINKMGEKYPQLAVIKLYINDQKNYELLGKFSAKYNITPGTLAVFIGDRHFITAEDVRENLESEILKYIDAGRECPQLTTENENYWISQFKSFGVLTIIFAGLVDGVNPCAMAALIFFISYLSIVGRKGRDILLIGIAFTSAVFVTYLLIGLGLFEFIMAAQNKLEMLSKIIYPLAGVCALIFFYFSLNDYFKASKGRAGEMTLQLPKKIKGIIHGIIRKQVRMRFFVAAAFTTGFLVSLFEFLCTGQVYLPTIIYITGIPELKAKAIFYLILYNLLFILPLILIFLAAYLGTTSKAISSIFAKHISTIKILTAILFFVLAVFMFIMSAEMFGIL